MWLRIASVVLLLASPALAEERITLDTLAGHWIDDVYADALAKTRSPLAAGKSAPATAFALSKNEGKWELFLTDFHEGYPAPVSGIVRVGPGTYELLVGKPFPTPRLRLTIERRGGALLVRAQVWEQPATYRRIDTAPETWANRLLLAGRYTDEHGRPVTLSPEGVATLPDQKPFKYKVVLDTSEACCDYADTNRKPKKPENTDRFAYRWRGATLELSAVIIDAEGECPISSAKEPFARLVRITN